MSDGIHARGSPSETVRKLRLLIVDLETMTDRLDSVQGLPTEVNVNLWRAVDCLEKARTAAAEVIRRPT